MKISFYPPYFPVNRESCSVNQRAQFASFTLIELLFVVAIISILAALLFPALRGAKESANSMKCLANLKQIGEAIEMYGNDNGCYPPGYNAGVTAWSYVIGPYLGMVGTTYATATQLQSPVMLCPSAKIPTAKGRNNYEANLGVMVDISASPSTISLVPIGGLTRPSDIIVVGDGCQYGVSGDGRSTALYVHVNGSVSWQWIGGTNASPSTADNPIQPGSDTDPADGNSGDPLASQIRYRHSGASANFLFGDGHVANIQKGQVKDRNIFTNY